MPREAAEGFIVTFDRADAAWLRGYANLLSALLEFMLAHDGKASFDASAHMLFPEAGLPNAELNQGPSGAMQEFGQAADLDAMLAIGQEFGVPVVEDAAQAIGTEDPQGRRVGSRGAIGTFSYFPSKNLGGFGDGGIITTNDEALATRMMRLRNHGMEPKYYHDEVGMNSRLDALQAAVLLVKMRHLDAWSAGRQKNAAFYDAAFAAAGATDSGTSLTAGGFQLRYPKAAPKGARHIYNQYTIRVPASIRDAVRQDLAERKIGTEIYYPVPLHLQKCFAHLNYTRGIFPHSELAALEAIALPIYPDLVPAQLEHVATSVIECVRNRMSR